MTVLCVEYRAANMAHILSGKEPNSIYSRGILWKGVFIVKAILQWVACVIEEICMRTGNWHGKAKCSSCIVTIDFCLLPCSDIVQHISEESQQWISLICLGSLVGTSAPVSELEVSPIVLSVKGENTFLIKHQLVKNLVAVGMKRSCFPVSHGGRTFFE